MKNYTQFTRTMIHKIKAPNVRSGTKDCKKYFLIYGLVNICEKCDRRFGNICVVKSIPRLK